MLHYLSILEQGKPRSDMTVEERISAADRRKMDGNDLFKVDQLEEAMQQYEMVQANNLLYVLFTTTISKPLILEFLISFSSAVSNASGNSIYGG